MMLTAIAACGVTAMALGSASNGSAIEVFRTTSPEGQSIVVTRSQHVERVVPTKKDLTNLPEGAVVGGGGDVTIQEYVACVRSGADEIVIWKKSYPVFEIGGTELGALKIRDIALRGDQAAVLYSDSTANVDLVERQADGQYSLLSHEELFRQSTGATKAMVTGRLMWPAWLGGLYAMIETTFHDEEIWLVERGSSQMLCTRYDPGPYRPYRDD